MGDRLLTAGLIWLVIGVGWCLPGPAASKLGRPGGPRALGGHRRKLVQCLGIGKGGCYDFP